ncbi:hypothetical protein [Empedobacter brevis]|uniref:hypothetical protein n=1 Tax=Empedobacter brevis TaxID=247 RepID=UPI00333E4882
MEIEEIKTNYAVEHGYINYKEILWEYKVDKIDIDKFLEHENAVIQLIEDGLKKYQAEQINMYKECLELFLPTDKWDEATLFLSTYGSGLAKDLSNKENIK